jgi:hypothetical protein
MGVEDKPKKLTGFALMSAERRAAASAKGGRKTWELGRAHKFTKAEAKKHARSGGLASAAARKDTGEQE